MIFHDLPTGKQNYRTMETSPFLMGKSTINGYLEDLVHPSYDCYPLVNVYKKKMDKTPSLKDINGMLKGY